MKRELRADGSCNAPHAAFSPLKAEQPGVMAELFLPSLAPLDELTPSEFLHVFTAMLDSRATHASVCVCRFCRISSIIGDSCWRLRYLSRF